MMNYIQNKSFLLLSTGLTGASLFLIYYYLKYSKLKNWEYAGKVSDLYIYPLKSGHFLRLKRAKCTSFGLQQLEEDEKAFQMLDRFLVVYREVDKSYCTCKTYPHMVLIKVSVYDHEHLAFEAPKMRTLFVKIPNVETENKDNVFLWDKQKVMTYDCGEEAASWLSRYILKKDKGLKLGYHDASERRNVNECLPEFTKIYKNLKNKSTGLYADIANYFVLNESSVKELNNRLLKDEIEISHKNFRPNIVVNGENVPPYDEDDWEYMKIKDIVFRFTKYCPRCLVTNVDVQNGNRLPGGQPLKALKDRKLKLIKNISLEGENPLFGIYFDILKGENNVIEEGDDVFIIKR